MSLETRNINDVKSIPLEVRGEILYQFLKMGISMREIGKKIPSLVALDGWQAWAIIHFYGFSKQDKGLYTNITLKNLTKRLLMLNEREIEEFHLAEDCLENIVLTYHLNLAESDGTDIFRNITARTGQYKLRKLVMENYHHQCALCKISNSKLLMIHQIKPWLDATKEERVNPNNAMILCRLHETLFAKGFLSLSDQYEVIFSSALDFQEEGISTQLTFKPPKQDPPGKEFLKAHREKFKLVVSQGCIF